MEEKSFGTLFRECQEAISAVLKVNDGQFATTILKPLIRTDIRNALENFYSYRGYSVTFIHIEDWVTDCFRIDVMKRTGGLREKADRKTKAVKA